MVSVSSPPSAGNTTNAVQILNRHLRSPVFNIQALRLFAAANREDLNADELDRIQSCCGNVGELTNEYGKELREAVKAAQTNVQTKASPRKKRRVAAAAVEPGSSSTHREPTEPDLTQALQHRLNGLFNEEGIHVLDQWPLNAEEAKGIIDLCFYEDKPVTKRITSEGLLKESYSVYNTFAFMEVGISASNDRNMMIRKWLEKFGQIATYLDWIAQGQARGPRRRGAKIHGVPSPDGSMILSVVALSKSFDQIIAGTFFCQVSEGSKDWRMALLFTAEGTNEDESSSALGKVLATIKLYKNDAPPETPTWRYLGPDCSEVTTANGDKKVRESWCV